MHTNNEKKNKKRKENQHPRFGSILCLGEKKHIYQDSKNDRAILFRQEIGAMFSSILDTLGDKTFGFNITTSLIKGMRIAAVASNKTV